MLKTFAKAFVLTATVALFVGCTSQSIYMPSTDNTVIEENNKVQVTKQHIQIANDKQLHVTTQPTLEGTINSLATQMMRNRKLDTRKPVLITSFVRLDNFKKLQSLVEL